MNKKILSFILAASMAAACSTAVSAGEREGGIVVLYTNDISAAVTEAGENQVPGYARIAGLKKQMEATGNDVIPADMGGGIQGDLAGPIYEGLSLCVSQS